jgi:hypothetical protein
MGTSHLSSICKVGINTSSLAHTCGRRTGLQCGRTLKKRHSSPKAVMVEAGDVSLEVLCHPQRDSGGAGWGQRGEERKILFASE